MRFASRNIDKDFINIEIIAEYHDPMSILLAECLNQYLIASIDVGRTFSPSTVTTYQLIASTIIKTGKAKLTVNMNMQHIQLIKPIIESQDNFATVDCSNPNVDMASKQVIELANFAVRHKQKMIAKYIDEDFAAQATMAFNELDGTVTIVNSAAVITGLVMEYFIFSTPATQVDNASEVLTLGAAASSSAAAFSGGAED